MSNPPITPEMANRLIDLGVAKPLPPQGRKPKAPPRIKAKTKKVPRNAPCPCRSGRKWKKCCGKKDPPVLLGRKGETVTGDEKLTEGYFGEANKAILAKMEEVNEEIFKNTKPKEYP